jgi:hypothetical protein
VTLTVDLWAKPGFAFERGTLADADLLLRTRHYLGPVGAQAVELVITGRLDGAVVAVMVWKRPTARFLPNDGTWLELARWCLTAEAGPNAGSRMHRFAVRTIRETLPAVTTLVSYSDPGVGHTGSLYKACNWHWFPTWHRLKPPPTGAGSWDGLTYQTPKDRWVFEVRRDPRRAAILEVKA